MDDSAAPARGGPPHGEVAKTRGAARDRAPAVRTGSSPATPRAADRGRRRRSLATSLKPLVFALALAPAAYLAWAAFTDGLGANPIKALEHETGKWAIRFLALSLAVTPLRKLLGFGQLATYRRPIGLFAFFYATIHLLIFAVLDLELDLGDVGREIVKRPYITIGFASWLLLVPLAATSTMASIRRLGGHRWNRLHRLVYAVAVLTTVHYFWSQKKDITDPLVFCLFLVPLLGYRWWEAWRKARRPAHTADGAPATVGRELGRSPSRRPT